MNILQTELAKKIIQNIGNSNLSNIEAMHVLQLIRDGYVRAAMKEIEDE